MTGQPEAGLTELPPLRGDAGYQLPVGRVLGQTFSVTFSNLPAFLLVGLIVYSPVLVLYAVGAVTGGSPPVYSLLGTLLQALLGFVLSGALTFGVVRHLRGQKAAVGEIAVAGVRSLVAVVGVSLLVGIVTTIGVILCVVPGIIAACLNWVAVPVAVIERRGILASLDRSHDLTRGTRWPVFAVLLVIQLIIVAASMVATVGLTIAGATFGAGLADPTVQALVQVALMLVLLPFQCLYAASAAVGYHDLRVHREGADVEDLVRVFE